jgi:lysozyme
MNISEAGGNVLIEREGMRLEAYQDSVGVWTIGVGHTAAAGPPEPKPGMTISEEEAETIFIQDLTEFEEAVNDLVKMPMRQHQYDAFVSICFNIGQGAFADSTFLERFNQGDVPGCAEAILMWDQPPEIIPRRQGEYVQFLGYIARIETIVVA